MSSPANTQQLSYCTVSPSGPLLKEKVTDELLECIPRETVGTQCVRMALVTTVPVIGSVSSGGHFNTAPFEWSESDDVQLANVMSAVVLNRDISTEMRQVADAQARFTAVSIADALGAMAVRHFPDANLPKNLPYFASRNPAGVLQPAAGAGSAATFKDLLRLRRAIQPHDAVSHLAFVMHSVLADGFEIIANQQGWALEHRRNARTGKWNACVAGTPILRNDHISLDEPDPAHTTSIYAVRFMDAGDPAGIEGLSLVVPPGGDGVRVSAPTPLFDGSDAEQVTLSLKVAFKAGVSTVARLHACASDPFA